MMTSDDEFEPQMTSASVRFIEFCPTKVAGRPEAVANVHGEIPEKIPRQTR